MADKKSFVMYMSWEKSVEKMTNEQAGQLLKAIYEYQSNPDACPENDGAALVFEIIKEKMDEDNAKYQKTCDSRAEAGRKGNEKRWTKENATDSNNNASQNIANVANAINATDSNNNASQNIANVADSESESESDTEKEKEKKEKPLKRLPSGGAKREGKAERNAALFEWLAEERNYSGPVAEKMREWMRYKGKAQGDEYEETGMRSLLSILDAKLKEFGEEAVLAEIAEAMGNGWKGIQWHRLSKPRNSQRQGGAPNRFLNFAQPDPGYDDIAKSKLKGGMPFGGDV